MILLTENYIMSQTVACSNLKFHTNHNRLAIVRELTMTEDKIIIQNVHQHNFGCLGLSLGYFST